MFYRRNPFSISISGSLVVVVNWIVVSGPDSPLFAIDSWLQIGFLLALVLARMVADSVVVKITFLG